MRESYASIAMCNHRVRYGAFMTSARVAGCLVREREHESAPEVGRMAVAVQMNVDRESRGMGVVIRQGMS